MIEKAYELTDEDKRNIAYFWLERGNLERWVGWERAKPSIARQFPEILQAWENYKASNRMLDVVVKYLTET